MVKSTPGPITNEPVVALNAVVRGVFAGRLTPADCRLLLCVRIVQALAAGAIAWTTVPAGRRALKAIRPLAISCRGAVPEARILWAFEASGRWQVGRATCLARAMAAEALLEGTDRPPRIAVGVTLPAAGFLKSHAWIERDGRVLVGGSESSRQYVPFVEWNSGAI